MKKLLISAMIFSLLFAPAVFSASAGVPTTTPAPAHAKTADKMTEIQKKIQDKLDAITKGGKSDQTTEKEIIIDRYKKKTTVPGSVTDTVIATGYDMGTLASMNIIGGLFEGGIIGAGCGLIGYSKNMNRDTKPLVTGTIIGMFTGMALGAGLSLYQTTSSRYSASDDYGYDLAGGTIIGILLGTAGGLISYGKTRRLENVSEGIGYGVALGAGIGLLLGSIETFIPEQYRGMTGKLRAMNIQYMDGGTVLSCNLGF